MIFLDVPGYGIFESEQGLRVGRDPEWADLVLDRDFVSRRHLEIFPDTAGYRVWDLGSQNGTSVNGRRVGASGQALQLDDLIQIGDVLEMKVVSFEPPPRGTRTTVIRGESAKLKIELHPDQFVVDYECRMGALRDTMPYQLGLALCLLAVYQRDKMGPVPDTDLRAFVWRGDQDQQEHGDINRLLSRLRQWFSQRGVEAPTIVRPKRAGATRLLVPAAALVLEPEGWWHRFLDRD